MDDALSFLRYLKENHRLNQTGGTDEFDYYQLVDSIIEELIDAQKALMGALKYQAFLQVLETGTKSDKGFDVGIDQWFEGTDLLIQKISERTFDDQEKDFWEGMCSFLRDLLGKWVEDGEDLMLSTKDVANAIGIFRWEFSFSTGFMADKFTSYYSPLHSRIIMTDEEIEELKPLCEKIRVLTEYKKCNYDKEELISTLSENTIPWSKKTVINVDPESNEPLEISKRKSIIDLTLTPEVFYQWLYRDKYGAAHHRMRAKNEGPILTHLHSEAFDTVIPIYQRNALQISDTEKTLPYILSARECFDLQCARDEPVATFLQMCGQKESDIDEPVDDFVTRWIVEKGKNLVEEMDFIISCIVSKDTHARNQEGKTNETIRKVLTRMYTIRNSAIGSKKSLQSEHLHGIHLDRSTTVSQVVLQLKGQFYRHIRSHYGADNFKKFKSQTVEAITSDKESLENIVRIDLGDKPFMCMYAEYLQQALLGVKEIWFDELKRSCPKFFKSVPESKLEHAACNTFFEFCFYDYFTLKN